MAVRARRGIVYLAIVVSFGPTSAVRAEANEWFVSLGSNGPGTSAEPFGRIQDGLNVARPGDTITVRPGAYAEALRTVRHGSKGAPIRLRAGGDRGAVIVSVPGKVLTVDHAYFIADGLVIDAQYANADAIDVNSAANYLVLRNLEVRRSSRDLIDISNPSGVIIEQCLLHHALNATGGRTDAHGIVAGAVQDLTVRDTEIHTFSGDGLQLDPNRSVPGWNRVTIENVRMWLAPLKVAENGFAVGIVPGENAIDTKANSAATRATLTVRNMTAWGFRGGLIGNMAAFNLKENIDATLDGVTVYESEIAFRLRGASASAAAGAWVTLKNAVVYDVLTAYRYENNIQQVSIWNNTLGKGVARPFSAASSSGVGLSVRNLLILGKRPAEASDSSNLAGGEELFVNATDNDYRLTAGVSAIDAGVSIVGVATDRAGVTRPKGPAYDVGAYEWQPAGSAENGPNNPRAIPVMSQDRALLPRWPDH